MKINSKEQTPLKHQMRFRFFTLLQIKLGGNAPNQNPTDVVVNKK
jgi:hypothetical protein